LPYIDGKRVSNEEWVRRYGSVTQLHTSERGVNPGQPFTVEAEAEEPRPEEAAEAQAPSAELMSSATKMAIANATGENPAAQGADEDGKIVVGTKVVDADRSQAIDTESVGSDQLSGGTPGEPSENSDDGTTDDADANKDGASDAPDEAEGAPAPKRKRSSK